MGASAAATLVAGIGAPSSSPQIPHATLADFAPADVVALRFPAEWDEAAPSESVAAPVVDRDDSPRVIAPADATSSPSSYVLASATSEPVPPPRAKVIHPMVQTASLAPAVVPHPKPVAAAPKIDMGRPGAVFNEAQLASIKHRLQLTPYQQSEWPAVEQALRDLSYKTAAMQPRKGAPQTATAAIARATGTIDPDSNEVQRLKSAAIPLVMSFSEEQKNEVRNMAHVIGLERLATSF